MNGRDRLSTKEEILAFQKERILQNDPTMKVFSLYQLGLFDKHIISLCEALRQNDYIEEVVLLKNQIGDKGIVALVEALPTIKKLDVSDK